MGVNDLPLLSVLQYMSDSDDHSIVTVSSIQGGLKSHLRSFLGTLPGSRAPCPGRYTEIEIPQSSTGIGAISDERSQKA